MARESLRTSFTTHLCYVPCQQCFNLRSFTANRVRNNAAYHMKILALFTILFLSACGIAEPNRHPTFTPPARAQPTNTSGTSRVQSANPDRSAIEDDIREAVFRYQFNHNASGLKQNAKVYYLSFGEEGKEPSDAFLERFKGHTPPVKKASEFNGGQQGLVFNVTTIQ